MADELKKEIIAMLEKCNDASFLDFILKLFQKCI